MSISSCPPGSRSTIPGYNQPEHANRIKRLRDAIDSRITEEQARQKDSLSRSSSARQPPTRTGSPSTRTTRPRRNTATAARGPDPKEFEADFALDDDDVSSTRSGTPAATSAGGAAAASAAASGGGAGAAAGGDAEGDQSAQGEVKDASTEGDDKTGKGAEPAKEGAVVNQAPSELPPEIKAKLRRLDKMETRYHGVY